MPNPFSPRSGATPPYLVGRKTELSDLARGFDSPLHDPSGNIVITGLRGTGKTVLLNKAQETAENRSWKVVDTYLSDDGLLDRVHTKIDNLLAPHHSKSGRTPSGGQLGAFGVSLGFDTEIQKLTLDTKMKYLAQETDASGLLITIDEVHSTAGDAQRQLGELGNEIQLAQRQDVPVMAVMAGLPGGIKELLRDKDELGGRKASTFLRRAHRMPIGEISYEEIWGAYRDALNQGGKFAATEVVDLVADAAKGYPYLFQLIGFHVWERSGAIISVTEARAAVDFAKRRLGQLVHDTALADLSAKDKTFLLAMSNSNGPTRMADIKDKLHVTKQNANDTRRRLIDAEMVVPTGRGLVDFAMPYMRDFLRDHAAAAVISDDDW